MTPGSTPTTRPRTWEELVAAGRKLVARSGDQVERWGMMIPSTGYPYWMFGALTMQNDQVLMNGDGNETYYDAPATREALQVLARPRRRPRRDALGTIEWGTLRKNFLEGKDRHHVALDRQPDRGEEERPVRFRRGHAAGEEAPRHASPAAETSTSSSRPRRRSARRR